MPSGVSDKKIVIAPHFDPGDAFIRGRIAYEAPAGAVIEDAVDLLNLLDEELEVVLHTVDAFTKEDGSFILAENRDTHKHVGKWMVFEAGENRKILTLSPGEKVTVPIYIEVPEDAEYGEYWGGVVVEETVASLEKRSLAVDEDPEKRSPYLINTRLGIRTMVDVKSPEVQEDVFRALIGVTPNPLLDDGIDDEPMTFLDALLGMAVWQKILLFLAVACLLWLGTSYLVSKTSKKHRKIYKYASWILLALIYLLFLRYFVLSDGLASVVGDGGRGLSITPYSEDGSRGSWFVFTGDPGDVLTGKAAIINTDPVSRTALVYAVDASIGRSGGFILHSKNAERRTVGKWTEPEMGEFVVGPRDVKIIDFTITLPENVEPGDHAGGLIVESGPPPPRIARSDSSEPVEEEGLDAGVGIGVQTRVGARIYLTATGERVFASEVAEFDLGYDDGGGFILKFKVENTGNSTFSPRLSAVLADSEGEELGEYRGTSKISIFPGNEVTATFELPWNRFDMEEGEYELDIVVSDSVNEHSHTLDFEVSHRIVEVSVEGVEVEESKKLLYIVLFSLLGVIVLLLLVLAILLFKGRKKEKAPPA